jgi:hypothetical protein
VPPAVGLAAWPEAAAGSGPEPDPRKASQLRLESAAVLDGYARRWLILAPKRVCTDVWPVEAPKWAPGLKLAVAVGTLAQRRAAYESNADVIVTNYDNTQSLPPLKIIGILCKYTGAQRIGKTHDNIYSNTKAYIYYIRWQHCKFYIQF